MPKSPPVGSSVGPAIPMFPGPDGRVVLAPGQTQSTSTSANPNPQMQFAGADAVPFELFTSQGATSAITVTFPNLAVRNTAQNPLNPLQSQQRILVIGPTDHLLLTCFIQGEITPNQVSLIVTPQALLNSGAIAVGPFLGSEAFRGFQAVVKIVNSPVYGPVSGVVAAHLALALGY